MTVLVTTCFTLTCLLAPADNGGAPNILVRPSIYQLVGENGDLRLVVLLGVALLGVALLGVALLGVALLGVALLGVAV